MEHWPENMFKMTSIVVFLYLDQGIQEWTKKNLRKTAFQSVHTYSEHVFALWECY